MTTMYLAVDRDGLTAPAGLIVGMSGTAQGLIDAGFTAGTYRGNRRPQVDTTDSNVWDNACQPGWYYVSSSVGVQRTRPATPLEGLKLKAHTLLTAGDTLEKEIIRQGRFRDNSLVAQAHQIRWKARGGTYLVLTDATRTIAARSAWIDASLLGPTDVTGSTIAEKTTSYFVHFVGVTHTDYIAFADPADATRTTLAGAIVIPGTIPATVDLSGRDWVDSIPQGA